MSGAQEKKDKLKPAQEPETDLPPFALPLYSITLFLLLPSASVIMLFLLSFLPFGALSLENDISTFYRLPLHAVVGVSLND